MVVGLLGNESSDSNRFTLVTPKSENDVRLQATLGNQNPTGLPVGVVSKDDVADIMDSVLNADVVVWATPIYYYEMSGQMKTLIDRLNPMYSKDYKFRDVYLLAAAAEEGDEVFEKVITGLNGWIDCFEKTTIKGIVLTGGVSDGGAISGNDKLKEAYDLGSHV